MYQFEKSSKFLLAGCMLAAAGEVAYPPPEALRLVEIALKQNPALASAHLSTESAHSEVDQNASWEAPEVGVEAYQTPIGSFPNPLKNGREYDYSVSQMIPFPGKLKAMAQPHHLHGAAEELRADALGLDLRRQILSAYADLYFAAWRLRLIREERIEVDRVFGTTRTVYEGGGGSQVDLLRIESEMAKLDAEALEVEQQKIEAQASIASLLGGARMEINPVDSMSPRHFQMNPDDLKRMALERRPDLGAMYKEIAMSDAEVISKKKEAYPDFAVQGMYKDMRMDLGARGFWSLGVGVKVPIAPWSWKGVQAGVEQARIKRRKAEQDYAATRLNVNADVERAAAALRTAAGRVEVMENRIIPLADQTFQSALLSYRNGKMDLSNALMAYRETRTAREEYHLAVADHLKAWAALEWATGGTLNSTTALEGK